MASTCYKHLTRKHGVKICATFPCSVEDISLAVGEKVGHGGVVSAARMNSAVVVFLDRVEKANSVVETGITVKSCFVQVLPLSQPATKVVLSNVPPFISDEFLSRELSRHGKVASPIRRMMSGCKSPLLKHVVSHRRQLYMILNNRNEELNLRFVVKVDDYDYTIFATSAGMKCFGCGGEGHTVKACPRRSERAPTGPEAAAAAGPPGAAGAAGTAPTGPDASAAAGPLGAAGVPGTAPAGPGAVAAAGVPAGGAAAVADPTHGVSSVDAPGVEVATEGKGVLGEGFLREGGGSEEGFLGGEGALGGVEVEEEVGGGVSGVCVRQAEGKAGEEGVEAGVEKEQEEEGGEHSALWSEQVEEAEMEEVEMEELNKKTKSAVKRRRSNRGKVMSECGTDESADEGCASDDSDVAAFSSSQKKKLVTVDRVKTFLAQTKGQKVKVTDHFPDLGLFITSARFHTGQKGESGLTEQECWRLKKLVTKAKRQLVNEGKGKPENVF